MTPAAGTVDAKLGAAIEFLGELRLPSGLRLADSLRTDPWLLDSVVRPILAKQPDGRSVNKFCWVELPKGSGKSSIAAALMLTEAAQEPGTECFITATDAEQARIILLALSGLMSGSRRLQAVIKQTQNLFTLSNGSFLRVMASDAASYHGLAVTAKRTRYLLEELCQWPSPDLYHAAMASMPKHPDSQMLILTNSGLLDSWQAGAKEKLQAAGAFMHVSPQAGCHRGLVRRAYRRFAVPSQTHSGEGTIATSGYPELRKRRFRRSSGMAARFQSRPLIRQPT